jgi:hypothetical protein
MGDGLEFWTFSVTRQCFGVWWAIFVYPHKPIARYFDLTSPQAMFFFNVSAIRGQQKS